MAHKVISEEELKLLLSSDCHKEEKEQPKKPKLTMKFLHEIVRELQYENLMLTKRIDELEQELNEFHQMRGEVATGELPVLEEPKIMAGMEKDQHPDVPQTIRIPRSERHPVPKKKSFWAFWFRPRMEVSS